MAVFYQRFNNELDPLFRLATELEKGAWHNFPQQRCFKPSFDMQETEDAYELQGELPGVDKSNINIEWSENNTLTISGSTEKVVEKTTEPEVEAPEEDDDAASTLSEDSTKYQKPSVEEENEDGEATQKAEVAKTEEAKEVAKPAAPKSRRHFSERSYGSFRRSFKFPRNVSHEGLTAKLNNGVLSIVVPKTLPQPPRKININ